MNNLRSSHALGAYPNNRRLSSAAKVAFFVCVFASFTSLIFLGSNKNLLFTSTGFMCFAVMLLPIAFSRNYDLLSTWSLACVSVTLGCLLRGIYIGFNYPDDQTLNTLYLRDRPIDEFYTPAAILVLSLLCCAIGFMLGPNKSRPNDMAAQAEIHSALKSKRLYRFAIVALIVSIASTLAFVGLTDGFDLQNLSRKRTTISSINLDGSHRTYGFLRSFASVALIAHLLVLADAIQSTRKKRIKYFVAFLLLLSAAFLPFYASSRSTVFIYLIMSMSVFYYCNKRIEWGRVFSILLVAVLLFQGMSILRSTREQTLIDVITQQPINVSIFDKIILNRNGIELAKTAHIVNAIPNQLDLQYGKTIAVWAIAVIPRDIWNSKPLISSGPIIGSIIYGNRVSGVPPGFVGDLYWNFHLPGVVLGGLFLGWLLRWVDRRFKPRARDSVAVVAVYIFGPFRLGYLVMGGGLGGGIFNAAVATFIALVLLRVFRVR